MKNTLVIYVHGKVILVANSIGAYFLMNAISQINAESDSAKKKISMVFFISPIVSMEKLICNMMLWAGVTEAQFEKKKNISLLDK